MSYYATYNKDKAIFELSRIVPDNLERVVPKKFEEDKATLMCWCYGYAILAYDGLLYAVKETEQSIKNYSFVEINMKELIKNLIKYRQDE